MFKRVQQRWRRQVAGLHGPQVLQPGHLGGGLRTGQRIVPAEGSGAHMAVVTALWLNHGGICHRVTSNTSRLARTNSRSDSGVRLISRFNSVNSTDGAPRAATAAPTLEICPAIA